MKYGLILAAVAGALVVGMGSIAASPGERELVAGGTEVALAPWTPGEGSIEPGGRIRGWVTTFEESLVGPAGDLASGAGPVTMSCNLDAGLTGPCWGTFSFTNAKGSWEGTWRGTFNFLTGAGSYRALGHGTGGLEGLTLHNDVVYPGRAVSAAGAGYIYATVRGHRRD